MSLFGKMGIPCIIFCVFMILGKHSNAQLKIGDNPYTVRTDASLELSGEARGLLLNRVPKAALNTAPLNSAPDGMIVYVKEDKQIYLKKGTWQPLADLSAIGSWSTAGNTGNDSSVHFIGTLDHQPIVFKVDAVERGRVAGNGFWGVGRSNPTSMLHVNGAIATSTITATGNITLVDSNSVVIMNNASDATVTLQSPVGRTGRSIELVAYNTGNVNYAGATVKATNGTTQTSLLSGYTVKLVSDGTAWVVVNKQRPALLKYNANSGSGEFDISRDLNAMATNGTGLYLTDVEGNPANQIPNETAWFHTSIVAKSDNGLYVGQFDLTDHEAYFRGGSVDTFANMSWRKFLTLPVNANFSAETEGNYDVNFNLKDNRDLFFSTNSNKRVTIQGDGDVGIGTTSPNAKLDVNGSVKVGSDGTPVEKIYRLTTGNYNVNTYSNTYEFRYPTSGTDSRITSNATVIINPRGEIGEETSIAHARAYNGYVIVRLTSVTWRINFNTSFNVTIMQF